MAQSVGDLIVNLDVDNTRFTEQMERVIRHTGSFGKAANDASAQAQQMADRQASALKSLLNSIDPTTKAFSNLDDQYTALQQHLNAGRIDASQFEYYNHILDESLTKLVDVGDAQEKVAEQARRTAAAESAATKRFLEGIDPTLRAFNRLDESVAELHQRFESGFIPEAQFKSTLAMLEQQRAKLYEVGDAAELTESAMGGMPAALSRHEIAAKRAGISVGQYTQALRFLPMQMTDVVTQLAGGQNPLLILIQQGGQVKDAFGGIRPAMVAMGDSLKGLIGVLNPVNLAIAVAVATLVAIPSSMAFASSSLGDIQKSLIMTGAAAFASAGDMANASERIGNATNTSFAATSSLMAELVQKGKYTGKQIEVITKATLDWGRATGETKDKVEGFFSQIADDPVQSMKALNNQFDFLSKAQAEHIATLDKAGQHTQAVTAKRDLVLTCPSILVVSPAQAS
ncbi:phage tail length tape-measure protein [Buttiauxella gaviniae ATCC 51604]|uniref:Phage tail length tape-measure protein n=1 Tax=Buttiauxella gaviniae ATCC 51604 TaxID=1354253 RepID=A0A1B7HMC7_9ENTR|nr:phage tail length tape measure family protein [Buttiauxella gaviniae]OAT16784.1 phage tail length tape-measure protein [Buttiauxella gaviniae ATCC 51604]